MTTTTCLETSMSSVDDLRGALMRSSRAGPTLEMVQKIPEIEEWMMLDKDFAALAHRRGARDRADGARDVRPQLGGPALVDREALRGNLAGRAVAAGRRAGLARVAPGSTPQARRGTIGG